MEKIVFTEEVIQQYEQMREKALSQWAPLNGSVLLIRYGMFYWGKQRQIEHQKENETEQSMLFNGKNIQNISSPNPIVNVVTDMIIHLQQQEVCHV